jgi:hypothetical protein
MADISIGCLLYNSEVTRAGRLDGFFRHIDDIAGKSGVDAEMVVLVDDKTTDSTMSIARDFCNPSEYHFEHFSQAKNLLLDKATSEWVLMTEPDLRFNEGVVPEIIGGRGEFSEYKCVEARQAIHLPGKPHFQNLYCILLRPELRFNGYAYDTVRAYPHEIARLGVEIGDHFMKKRDEHNTHATSMCARELEELEVVLATGSAEELYWGSFRYFEFGSLGILPGDEADGKCVAMLEKAISLKPDFGPAYFDLAMQYHHMGIIGEALAVAQKGAEIGYSLCSELVPALMPSKCVIIKV